MKCHKCGADVPEAAKFCRNCGAVLGGTVGPPQPGGDSASAEVTGPAGAPGEGGLRCPTCGSAVTPDRPFCAKCGAKLAFPQQPPVAGPASVARPSRPVRVRKPINWRKVGLTVGVPALLAGLIFAGWHFWPRVPLPPRKIGTILNRATAGNFVFFNDGAPGRQEVLLSAGSHLWEIPSGNSLHPGMALGSPLSPDGDTFLTGNRLSLFNWKTKHRVDLEDPAPHWVSYTKGGGRTNPFSGPVRFSDDGTLLAASRPNGSLYLLNATTGAVIHTLREGSNQITPPYNDSLATCTATSLSFSPGGNLLASGELNGDVTLWNTATGDQLKVLREGSGQLCEGAAPQSVDAVDALAFSPDGRLLASVDLHDVVRIWRVATGKVQHALPSSYFPDGLLQIGFSPDGRYLVVLGFGTITNGDNTRLSDAVYFVWDAAKAQLLRALSFPGQRGTFGFSPNGNLVTAQIADGRAKAQAWALRSRLRLPFGSANATVIPQSDPALIKMYEDEALQQLNYIENNLGTYMGGAGGGSFPHSLEDLSKASPAGNVLSRKELHGYRFSYTPGQADQQGHITGFVLTAQPLVYKVTGTRSFRVDQTGQAYATDQDREATTADTQVSGLTSAVQVAQAAKGVALQQAASDVARARTLFQQSQFQAALSECEAALTIDPSNQDAAKLKAQIEQTMKILGQGLPPQEQQQPHQGSFTRAMLLSRGFAFDDQPRAMCPINGPNGPCAVEAFVGGERRGDRTGYTCSKLDRASYTGSCVDGALQGVSVVIADGTSKVGKEAFLSYFSKGRIAYPSLSAWLDPNQPDFFGVQEKNVSYGCVVFGKWNLSRTRGDCPRLTDAYGSDLFSEANLQRLRDGTFDLSHYSAKFTEYMTGK